MYMIDWCTFCNISLHLVDYVLVSYTVASSFSRIDDTLHMDCERARQKSNRRARRGA